MAKQGIKMIKDFLLRYNRGEILERSNILSFDVLASDDSEEEFPSLREGVMINLGRNGTESYYQISFIDSTKRLITLKNSKGELQTITIDEYADLDVPTLIQPFSGLPSVEKIKERVRSLGGFYSSNNELYKPEVVSLIIDQIVAGRRGYESIPRTGGLRLAIYRILEKSKK